MTLCQAQWQVEIGEYMGAALAASSTGRAGCQVPAVASTTRELPYWVNCPLEDNSVD